MKFGGLFSGLVQIPPNTFGLWKGVNLVGRTVIFSTKVMPLVKECRFVKIPIQSNPACHDIHIHTYICTYIHIYIHNSVSLYEGQWPRPTKIKSNAAKSPFSQFFVLYISRRLPPFPLYKQFPSFYSTLQLLTL